MKIENICVANMEAALRGMRNPMNSWAKSTPEADVELGRKLASAGATHGKFLRMITITCDITAPLYWWKEFDTYKVGTVANSCSTMHTLTNRALELDDFETEDFDTESCGLKWVIDTLNDLIAECKANPKNNTESWRALIAMLPSCYLQKRTVMLNYEVLRRIVKDRTGHKLKEWKYFIEAMSALPYYTEFILGKTGEECMKESVKKVWKECLKDNANAYKEAACVKEPADNAEKISTQTVEISDASLDDILKATVKAAEELRKNIITDKNSKPKAPCCVDISRDTKYTRGNRVRVNGLQDALNHIDEVVENFNNLARDISNNKIESLYKEADEKLMDEYRQRMLDESTKAQEETKKKSFNELRAGFGLPPIKDDIQKEFISNDPINPAHYKDHCSIECIEAMEIAFGEWETGYFCLGNAFKYLWRHKYKNGQEDLKKAIWYLNKAEKLGADPRRINDFRDIVEKYMKKEE